MKQNEINFRVKCSAPYKYNTKRWKNWWNATHEMQVPVQTRGALCATQKQRHSMLSWDILAGQTLTTFSWHLLQDMVWILHDTRLLHFDVCGNFFSAHAQWYCFVLRGYMRWTCWKANLIGPLFLHLPPYSHMDVCLKWLPDQAVNWAEIKGGQGKWSLV